MSEFGQICLLRIFLAQKKVKCVNRFTSEVLKHFLRVAAVGATDMICFLAQDQNAQVISFDYPEVEHSILTIQRQNNIVLTWCFF